MPPPAGRPTRSGVILARRPVRTSRISALAPRSRRFAATGAPPGALRHPAALRRHHVGPHRGEAAPRHRRRRWDRLGRLRRSTVRRRAHRRALYPRGRRRAIMLPASMALIREAFPDPRRRARGVGGRRCRRWTHGTAARWSDQSRSRADGGSGLGLGLAVARSITVAHGGTLELVDRDEIGACFVLWPRLTHPAPP